MSQTKKRRHAVDAVRRALLSGDLKRGVCEVSIDCEGQLEAHHDDYDKPLEIRWLCKKHHVAHHREMLRALPRCEVVVAHSLKCEDEPRQCSNAATTTVGGVRVCGTHRRTVAREQRAAA